MNPVLAIVVVLAVLVIIGCARERVDTLFNAVFLFLARPLGLLMTALAGVVAALIAWIRIEIREEAAAEPGAPARPPYHLNRILCGVLFTGVAVLTAPPEVYLTRMALALMGLAGEAEEVPPVTLDWLAAASLLACTVFWGIVLFDLGRGTNLLPDVFTRGGVAHLLWWIGWICMALAASLVVVLGVWRGLVLTADLAPATPAARPSVIVPADPGPQSLDVFVATYFNAVLSTLIMKVPPVQPTETSVFARRTLRDILDEIRSGTDSSRSPGS